MLVPQAFPPLTRRKNTRQIPLYYLVKVSPLQGLPIVVSHGCAAMAGCGIRRRQRRRGHLRDPAASAKRTEFKVFEVECSKSLKLNVQEL
jgi:hypothetical protein